MASTLPAGASQSKERLSGSRCMCPRQFAASGHAAKSAVTTAGAAWLAAAKCRGALPSSSRSAAAPGQAAMSAAMVSADCPLHAALCSSVCLPCRVRAPSGKASRSRLTTTAQPPLATAPVIGRLPSRSCLRAALESAARRARTSAGGAPLQHAKWSGVLPVSGSIAAARDGFFSTAFAISFESIGAAPLNWGISAILMRC
mmetsp:Transcript_33504/g.88206  ORF Transcript_33504/g.88206 Transcript_33504/m.88206 type:complete len:201 (+) Transcript_33504:367-969(+)